MQSLVEDAYLTAAQHGELPEIVAVILAPRGRLQLPTSTQRASRLGNTGLTLSWRVVNLWEQDAEAFLATEDPGVMPWVPLMASARPPAEVFRECKRVIEAKAPPERVDELLAMSVAQGTIRYDSGSLWEVFSGSEAMLELPFYKELERRNREAGRDEGKLLEARAAVRDNLSEKFSAVPADLDRLIDAEADLSRLVRWRKAAIRAADLDAFRRSLDD